MENVLMHKLATKDKDDTRTNATLSLITESVSTFQSVSEYQMVDFTFSSSSRLLNSYWIEKNGSRPQKVNN